MKRPKLDRSAAVALLPYVWILGLVLSLAPTGLTAQSGSAAERIREAERSIVRVITRGTGETGTGSGAVVAPGIVLTNYHVIEDGVEYFVVSSHTGGNLQARVRWQSAGLDLAVLDVEGLALPTVALGTMALRVRDPVWALGYPGVSDDASGEMALEATWTDGAG